MPTPMGNQKLELERFKKKSNSLRPNASLKIDTRAGDAMMKDMFIKRRNQEQRLYEKYSRAEENVD